MQADGTIYVDTKIGTSGFEAGGKEIEALARRMAKSVSGIGSAAEVAVQRQVNAFVKQNQAYAAQEQKVDDLRAKLDEMLDQKVETDEYSNLSREIEKTEAALDKAIEKQIKFVETGGNRDSRTFSAMEYDIENIKNRLDEAKTKKKELEESGAAYTPIDTAGAEQKLLSEEEKLRQMNFSLGTSFSSLQQKVNKYMASAADLESLKKKLNKTLQGMIRNLLKAGLAMLGLNKKTKSTNKAFGLSLKNILRYGISVRSSFALINKLRSAVVSGFQNLAHYSDRTNGSISSLMSGLTQLKNSLATAFAPILNTIAPALRVMIDLLSRAATYVGMFIAALTGQKTFEKAVSVQQDYRDSLNGTASAAKNAKKETDNYLSGLDEVRRFETPDDNAGAGAGTGLSAKDMFETVPVENSIAGMVEKIKDLIQSEDWEGLGNYMASGLNAGLQKVYGLINWENIGPQIIYFVDAFTGTLNGLVEGINWTLMGRTVGAGVNTVVNTLDRLIEGVNWKDMGESFSEGINGLVEEVEWTNLGNLLGNKFMAAWRFFEGFVGKLGYEELGAAIAALVNGAIDKIELGTIFGSLSDFVIGILNTLTVAIRETNWEKVGQEISDALAAVDWLGIAGGLYDAGSELINGLLKAFGELPGPVQLAAAAVGGFFLAFKVAPILQGVISFLTGGGGLVSAIGAVVSALGGPLTIAIAAAIAILTLLVANWDEVKAVMKKFDDWIQGVFSHDWTKEFGVMGDGMNAFFASIKNIWNGIKNVFQGIIGFIKGVFTGNWRQAWEGVKQALKGVWDTIVGVIKTPINIVIGFINSMISGIIAGINMVIRGLNKFHIDIPDNPITGELKLGINIPELRASKIPYLATGAVIPPNAPFVAMLGDQKRGTNIETPESLLRKIMREELPGQRQVGGGTYTFVGQINRRTLFEEFISEAKLRQMQTGRSPFEGLI